MKRYLSNVVLSLLMLTLVGCGFHLKGKADLPDGLNTMLVQGVTLNRGIGKKLRRSLMQNEVVVLEQFQQGAAILSVLEHNIERRVLTVGGTDAKVSEYELLGTLTYRVTDETGQVIVPKQRYEIYRDYRYASNQVLAAEEEDAALREEIQQELVDSLIRRLSILK
jgi:LPS-assembly lipoprotein